MKTEQWPNNDSKSDVSENKQAYGILNVVNHSTENGRTWVTSIYFFPCIWKFHCLISGENDAGRWQADNADDRTTKR